jgi:hypothetical protein
LRELDRNALLLRYFEGRPFGEVGARLGLTEEAARMRVERALEKLRKLLASRGLVSTSCGLGLVISQQAISAAPVGLATMITGGAVTAGSTGTVLTIIQTITMTKVKAAIIAAVIAGASVPFVFQQKTIKEIENLNIELAQQNRQLAAQVEQESQLRQGLTPAARGPSLELTNELMRLRAEVTRLRADARNRSGVVETDSALQETINSLAARATRLKQRLAQMPDKSIPELQYITEKDWLDAVEEFKSVESDEEARQALNELRARAKSAFANKMREALRKYAEANNGLLPARLSQVQTYFDVPIDPAVFERYQLQLSGKLEEVGRDHNLVAEVAPPVDEEYDSRVKFDLNGITTQSYSPIGDKIESAAHAYAQANNGLLPKEAGQLSPYLEQEISAERIQKFLNKIPPGVTRLDQMVQRK